MRFSRLVLCLILTSSFILLTSSFVLAQAQTNPDAGLAPYATWEGGQIDRLNMENGSLFLKIPLVNYPQRGALKLSFSMISNNTGWYAAATP